MDEKFEGKPVVRDIEICKKCQWFKKINDPIVNDGYWHRGVGVYCGNYFHMCNSGWCAETNKAVSEEEFVRATKRYANLNECLQYKNQEN